MLDNGCGTAKFAAWNAHRVRLMVGSDPATLFADAAVEQVALAKSDSRVLPFADNSFDKAFSIDVLEHFPREVIDAYLQETARVLRPGGWVLCSEGTGPWSGSNPDWLDSGVRMQWEIAGAEATREQVRAAGFEVVETAPPLDDTGRTVDAAAVTERLDSAGLTYELREGGTAVYVEADQVDEARMRVASGGALGFGSVGYEIFDETDALGTTSFVQNVNARRALEGELARSINTLASVSAARVHLVLPERRLFSRDQQEPSASVVINVNGELRGGQVETIRNLVATAVAGLSPTRITIADDSGRLLASPTDGEALTSAALEDRRAETERARLQADVIAPAEAARHAAEETAAERDRAVPKRILRGWVSWLSGRPVPDINSGMRVFRKEVVERFFGILPDSFSFTITITLAMLTNYRDVEFVPIDYAARVGKSKIKPFKDTSRFFMLIMRTGTYFAPMRVFFPLALLLLGFIWPSIYTLIALAALAALLLHISASTVRQSCVNTHFFTATWCRTWPWRSRVRSSSSRGCCCGLYVPPLYADEGRHRHARARRPRLRARGAPHRRARAPARAPPRGQLGRRERARARRA